MMNIPDGATHYNKNESNLFYKIVSGFHYFWSPSNHNWMECGAFQEGFIDNLVCISDPSKLERLRDEFAMAALTGLLTGINARNHESPPTDLAARLAYSYADAALKAREQSK